mgnify:CR=1 FL=1
MIKYHLHYGIAKELMHSTLGKHDAIFWIIHLDPDHSKGTHKVPNLNFHLHAKVGLIILQSEHVEMKENSEKLVKITVTFRHTTYIKAIRLPSSFNINHFHGIEHGRGCVNRSSLLRTRK